MKKKFSVLRKFWKRTEKIIFSLVFICFRFTEISCFMGFPSNTILRKQHLFANAYFWVNMKFSYTIAGRTVMKTSDFLLAFKSTFRWQNLSKKWNFCCITAKTSYWSTFCWRCLYFSDNILQETWSKNCGPFFLLHGNKCSFIITNFIKVCSQKLGYWI